MHSSTIFLLKGPEKSSTLISNIMNKIKTQFTCTDCTYTSIKWFGCCPECKAWDSLTEKQLFSKNSLKVAGSGQTTILKNLSDIEIKDHPRICAGIDEWDRVIGGGLVPGSLIIVTGDPGIGKSTLLLQIAATISREKKVFYFSTEESLQQIKSRALRLGTIPDTLWFSDTADLKTILDTAKEQKPDIIVLDSIQNCYLSDAHSAPGSINQLKEATFQLMRLSKEKTITVIVTGHITKEGIIAGPKTLEHMVDAVFYLQGEERWQTRILRAVKNRFGAINELGFFSMESNGLQEIPNINAHLINDISYAPGSVLISIMEGSRPLLLELQALTNPSKLAMPQRVVSGVDPKQVILIAAILEKYVRIKLSMHDIFFKISGSFKIRGNESDLGIALALLSSYFQKPLPEKSIALGEISLTGQIKPVNNSNQLIKEAVKFGIQRLFVAHNQSVEKDSYTIHRFHNVYDLLHLFSE
jgi:DNA repair protein RadA/Sms